MAKAPDNKPENRTNTDPEPLRRNWVDQVSADAKAAASTFARAGFRDPTLVLRWADIAGPDIARMATPVKLTESPGGATLTLKAEPGGAVFLQHQTRALCERINAYLGRPAVSRLRFVQGPLIHRPKPAPRPVRAASAPPGDVAFGYRGPDKLKNALINLARARRVPPASD